MVSLLVIPAKAGILLFLSTVAEGSGTPASAGVTVEECRP
jgi:hypothetical protein